MRNHGNFGITLALALLTVIGMGNKKAEAQFRPHVSVNASASVGVSVGAYGNGYGNARNWYGNEWMYGNMGGGYWGGNVTGPRYVPDRGTYVQTGNANGEFYYVPGSAYLPPGVRTYPGGVGGYVDPGHEYLAGGYMHPPVIPNCESAAGGYWGLSPFTTRFCASLATQSFVARYGYGLTPVTGFARWTAVDFANWGNRFVQAEYELPTIRVDTNGFDYSQMAAWSQTVNNPQMPTLPVSQPGSSTPGTSTPALPPIATGSSVNELKEAFKRQVKLFDDRLCALEKNCDENEK